MKAVFRLRSLRLGVAVAVAAAAIATTGVAGDAKCTDITLDHGTADSVQLLNPDGTAAETLPNVGAPGSLIGVLKIYNCNADYYAVKYKGQNRRVSRNAVVPVQKDIAQVCKDGQKGGSYGQLGSSDSLCP